MHKCYFRECYNVRTFFDVFLLFIIFPLSHHAVFYCKRLFKINWIDLNKQLFAEACHINFKGRYIFTTCFNRPQAAKKFQFQTVITCYSVTSWFNSFTAVAFSQSWCAVLMTLFYLLTVFPDLSSNPGRWRHSKFPSVGVNIKLNMFV